MNHLPVSADEAPWYARPVVSLARGFRDFWFAPGDPTTLGFIRICTGLVLLCVLLASGPLLTSHYGPDAWIDKEASNALRKEYPWLPPDHGWEVENVPTWFTEMDANGDGVVTKAEWTGASREEFERIDVNPKDDRITLEEANAHGPFLIIRPELATSKEAQQAWEHWGMHPARMIDTGQPFFSHFFHLETATQRAFAHGLALLVVLLFTLGVGTRVTSVLTWVAALCYSHRVPVEMFGMDTMMGIVLLYLMIGPCGAALSVDHWLTNWNRRRHGLPEVELAPSPLATTATRLLQLHFCVMYFVAGTSKLQGAAWWNGTAIWMTLTSYEFVPKSEGFSTLLRWLTINRWVWETFHTLSAWGTVTLEISLPFLIWNRKWRWLLICASVGMHTFIAVTMGLTAFSLFMVCILFAFVPPETVKAALAWGQGVLARVSRPAAAPAAEERREEVQEPAAV